VIAGHVAWNGEAGVFSDLVELRRGDRVEVGRADGTTAVFAIQAVRRFSKAEFPTRAVFGAVDHSALRLITCGGLYDGSTNRYLDNVVAFAELIRVRR
jgi:sortase (surface protein transpeptidase)